MTLLSLPFRALSFTTVLLAAPLLLAPQAAANINVPLPEISADQIARDIERRQNPQTGAVEYYAPSFDPFEAIENIAGTVSLRSNTRVTATDGHILRGGALLDVNFFYTTESDDPYDVAGFEDAVFLSGEAIRSTFYNNRIIECSEKVSEVVYDEHYYTGASFGLIAGIYRPFPRYRGHRGFGHRGFSYNWRYPSGFSGRQGFNRQSGFNRGSRFGNNRGGGVRGNRRNDRDDRSDRRRDRDDRSDRRRSRRGEARNGGGASFSGNPDKSDRSARNGLRTIKGNSNRNSARNSDRNRRRNGERGNQRNQSTGAPIKSRPVKVLPTGQQSQQRSAPPRSQRPVRSQPKQSQPKKVQAKQSQPKKSKSQSSKRSDSRRSQKNSRPKRSINKATNRSFKGGKSRVNSSARKPFNFFPQGGYYGGYSSRKTVSVSQLCAREENLSVYIPRERLDAARYDGLTVLILDRDGKDIPVYIPPNYIEGFRNTAFAQSAVQSAPQEGQGYFGPEGYSFSGPADVPGPSDLPPGSASYGSGANYENGAILQNNTGEPFPPGPNPSRQPRIYGDPNFVGGR